MSPESDPARVEEGPVNNSVTRISNSFHSNGKEETGGGGGGGGGDVNNYVASSEHSTLSVIHGPSSRSGRSIESLIRPTTTQMKSTVHNNLIRTHHNRDPMRFYKVISILGQGSMGSVAKVVKKESAVGGSARSEFVRQEHGYCYEMCNKIFPPLVAKLRDLRTRNVLETVPKPDQQSASEQLKHQFMDSTIITSTSNGKDGTTLTDSISNTGTSNATGGSKSLESNSVDGLLSSSTTSALRSSSQGDTLVKFQDTNTEISGDFNFAKNQFQRSFHRSSSSIVRFGNAEQAYYALKSIHLDRCSSKEFQEELRNEVEVLKGLDHPNIVRAIETFDYNDRLFLLLELCLGGDLYARDPYNENDAKRIVNCIISAVTYLHSKGVVHRDLKYENICFADTSENAEVRIIDFGLSQKFAANEHLHDAVGTVYTMAPELLRGSYDSKVDLWSIGVITFSLLSSSLPFYGKDRVTVMKKVLKGKYRFSSKRWNTVSIEAKEFVHKLLQQDPKVRPSGSDALELPWLNMDYSVQAPFTMEEIEQLDKIQASIEAFAGYQILKKLGLMVIAYKSTSQQIGFVRKLFNRFDRYRDGEISFQEFKDALSEHYDYTDDELKALYNGIDVDGTGQVHYIEFLAATIEAHGMIEEERLAEAFDRIDDDDSGYISVKNLRDLLGQEMPQSYLEKIIDEADIVRDHRVSYKEFLAMWNDEADAVMEQAQLDVRARRKALPGLEIDRLKSNGTITTLSTGSSTEDDTLGDISLIAQAMETENDYEDDPALDPLVKEPPADFYFSQRKFQSMRKVEIDMTNMIDL